MPFWDGLLIMDPDVLLFGCLLLDWLPLVDFLLKYCVLFKSLRVFCFHECASFLSTCFFGVTLSLVIVFIMTWRARSSFRITSFAEGLATGVFPYDWAPLC